MNIETPNNRQKFDFVGCTFVEAKLVIVEMKRLGVLFVAISLLIISVLFISPEQVRVSGAVDVSCKPEVAFKLISCVDNYIEWNSLVSPDPSELLFFTDNRCGNGASVNWSGVVGPSVNVAVGHVVEGSSIEILAYIDGDSVPLRTKWRLQQSEDGMTNIAFDHAEPETPWLERAINFYRLRSVRKQLLDSVEKLKESAQAASGESNRFSVSVDTVAPFEYVGLHGEVRPDEVNEFIKLGFDSIRKSLGMPAESQFLASGAIFRSAESDAIDVTVIVNTDNPERYKSGLLNGSLDLGRSVVLTYEGDLENVDEAHYYARQYIIENDLNWANYCVEGYQRGVSDQGSSPVIKLLYPLLD